ncbi:MAG: amidohydrolase [Bacteroidales bacterium]|nr:amidohydrolase [Bacteroidales bacterium]
MNPVFDLDRIIKIRQELHANPELSDNEFITAERIVHFLSELNHTKLIRGIGGNGIACIFEGIDKGPSVLFRCDMDALPINEINDFDYKSKNEGVSHKCGHDGHMAIMLGLAQSISNTPPTKGQVVLLFQPAEETGQGASRVLNDSKFNNLEIDYVFALHNLPGYPLGNIIVKEDTFAAASKGMIIKLHGKTSHAGEPQDGISPAIAMADIIKKLNLVVQENTFSEFTLITIIHAQLGEIAFGTSPGHAHVMATLRTYSNTDMDKLTLIAEHIANEIAEVNNLKIEISYTEKFLATINSGKHVNIVRKVAKNDNFDILEMEKPFNWSEDFSYFTNKFSGVLFGVGAGESCPQLHNPDYDFPDKIIPVGIKMFYGIFKQIQAF